ncbi:MAG: phosphotransferase [Legionella sp.]|nr:MAG: phosphotransferase [Legionella sp.]
MQTRENALHQWLQTVYHDSTYTLTPLAGDASFRRYYRLQHANLSRIVMDSPPDKIPLAPFIQIQQLLSEQGLHTPHIHALDDTLGFAVLEDFGNVLFRDALLHHNPDHLYPSALAVINHMQNNSQTLQLAKFDQAFMLQELNLFHDWFLDRYLGLTLSPVEHQLLAQTFDQLTTQIANQPQAFIHRDYHSRNIMLLDVTDTPVPQFGIIDFQDAMLGPITYDLVSLLKDCYIQLPEDQITLWLADFYGQSTLAQSFTFFEFQRAFDWCGLQRHLKVLGNFCRLHLRDGKPNYLNDLPLTYHYVTSCIQTYSEFEVFGEWLQEKVQARFMSTCS